MLKCILIYSLKRKEEKANAELFFLPSAVFLLKGPPKVSHSLCWESGGVVKNLADGAERGSEGINRETSAISCICHSEGSAATAPINHRILTMRERWWEANLEGRRNADMRWIRVQVLSWYMWGMNLWLRFSDWIQYQNHLDKSAWNHDHRIDKRREGLPEYC